MFKDNKWTVTALVVIAMALFLTRGGAASVGPLVRMLLPAIIAVVVYRFISAKLRELMGQGEQHVRREFRWPPQRPQDDERRVIDLCPKCGSYMRPGHRCQPKS